MLPAGWSHANPVDIIGDAGPERYRAAMSAILEDKGSDAVLVIQCPTALADPLANARAVLETAEAAKRDGRPAKPLFTCWLGEASAKASRDLFAHAGVPTFETPSDAIVGFMQLVRHTRAQTELIQTPDAGSITQAPETQDVSRIIAKALEAGRTTLSAVEAKAILAGEGIPVAASLIAATPEDVRTAAAQVLAQQ